MKPSDIRMYLERTGYRFRELNNQSLDEHVARYMALTADFSSTGALKIELERTFETLTVLFRSGMQTRSDGSASTNNQWIAQVQAIPGLQWQVVPRGQQPRLPVEVPFEGEAPVDFRLFTDNPEALKTILANPRVSEALTVLSFVSVHVANGVATFTDNEQKNVVAASGGSLGLALSVRGQGVSNVMEAMQLVHDQIAELLWAISRSHAAYPGVELAAVQVRKPASGEDEDAHFPVLCRSCGAPATPNEEFFIHCSYCGQDDQLPVEQRQRSAELKRRVQGAARATAHVEGIGKVFTQIFESSLVTIVQSPWVKKGLPIIAFIVAVGLYNVVMVGHADRELGVKLFASSIPQVLQVAAIPVAALLALFATRPLYAARLRPLLLARPSRTPGQAMRCRACGGSLADGNTLFVRCEHCATENLVSPLVQSKREELLRLEEAEYRSQTRKAVGNVRAITTALKITFVGAFVLVFGVSYLLSVVAAR